MASCKYCGLDMLNSDSCLKLHEEVNGERYRRLVQTDGRRCHDCGILMVDGNAHHPPCDNEVCPVCGGQAFCCDCNHGSLS